MDILIFTHSPKPPIEEAKTYLDLLGINRQRACYLMLNYSTVKDLVRDIHFHCMHLRNSSLVIFDANYGAPNSAEFNKAALIQVLMAIREELEINIQKNFIIHLLADNLPCFEIVKVFIKQFIQDFSDSSWCNRLNIVITDGCGTKFAHGGLVSQISDDELTLVETCLTEDASEDGDLAMSRDLKQVRRCKR